MPYLEKELGVKLQLGYASWLDGIEEEGVKIEQYLDKKIFSDFVSKNTVRILDVSNKKQVNLVLSPEEFNKQKNKIDLLLDEKENKIYVRGKMLTSRELHSKKTAINILKILFQNVGKEVSNRELPSSSYSSDRYELQGKITSSLIKIVQKRTKKKFDLKVRGGVVDFFLKFNPSNVKIWLVKK